MSEVTSNLKLFKYDVVGDAKQPFSIEHALNDNWDLLDSKVVRKTGDTMTGDLIIRRANTVTYHTRCDDFNYTTTTAPASQLLIGRLTFRDKNNMYTGGIENRFTTSNRVEIGITSQRSINGTNKSATLKLGVTNTGDARCEFPRCTSKATTTSSAANDKVAVVVQNYVNGTSWYRVWSDGWKEQGGVVTANSTAYTTGKTINLLKAFANTNYNITLGLITQNSGGAIDFQDIGIVSKATNSFVMRMENTTYLQSVDWRACGY